MIYITQLIYLQAGQEAVFEAFEEMALPLIPRYGGTLCLRIRPDKAAWIAGAMEQPYEIHLVSFPDQDSIDAFMQDDGRKQFLHLKEQSIRMAWLIQGRKI
ncbi:MAG: DUF1330 domain-containing protein [Chitinophagaceae bacterium]|nr:DUF1330 domain-containing protein [Chitinophagaceae bacterium]